MGQYDRHVFVCTSGETCPTQGDVDKFVKLLRDGARQAKGQIEVRVNKAGCFSQCGHGPMMVVYPENVWYAGVQESDLPEILASHIVGGQPVERLRYAPGKPGANKIEVAEKKPEAPKAAARWKRVCATGDVPPEGMKEFAVEGLGGVLVAHTPGGFMAVQALCPHEAIPLEMGVHDGCTLTCLEHMWQFDLRSGAPQGDATEGVKTYPVKEEKGELFVSAG